MSIVALSPPPVRSGGPGGRGGRGRGAGLVDVPDGFPGPGERTAHRRILDAIISGRAPAPPCVGRFALPRPSAWAYATLTGSATPTEVETWEPGVVFGGYLACLVDQFAGLVMLTVLPDAATFLTYDLTLGLRAQVRPGRITIRARVEQLTAREAGVRVELRQRGRITGRAGVIQVIQRRGIGGS